MRTSQLIRKLNRALSKYGDIEVTVSETLWLYNTVKSVRYIKNPYEDKSDPVIEIVDYESQPGDWFEVV